MKHKILSLLAASCLVGVVGAADREPGRGREMSAISEDVDHSVAVTLAGEVKFRPERGAKNFLITLPAGRYTAFGKDAKGTYYLCDGAGVLIPGNFGLPKKGGIYVPAEAAQRLGVWLLPPHYSAKSGVNYLADLPDEASAAVRKALQ